jgi:predicted ester cyclase
MSIDANEALIRRFVEARNNHDVEAFVAFFPAERQGQVRNAFNRTTQAFPDVHITLEEVIGEGDKIALRWSFRGTHRGPYQDIPATGLEVDCSGIDVYTIQDETIVTLVREQDNLGLCRQLGVAGSGQ